MHLPTAFVTETLLIHCCCRSACLCRLTHVLLHKDSNMASYTRRRQALVRNLTESLCSTWSVAV